MPEARSTKGPTEERVQRFAALLDTAFGKIENQEPIKGIGKVSPVEVALEPLRDRICIQLDRGYRAGTIARIIKQGDQLDDTFAQETIRLAILRISNRARKPEKPATKGSHRRKSGSSSVNSDASNVGGDAVNEQPTSQTQDAAPEAQSTEQYDPMAFYQRRKTTEDDF